MHITSTSRTHDARWAAVLLGSLAGIALVGACSSDAAVAAGSAGSISTAGMGATSLAGATSTSAAAMGGATGAAGAGSSPGGAAVVVGGAPNAGTGGDSGGTLGLSGGTGGTAPALPSCSPITVSNTAVTLITDFSDPGTSFGNYTNNFSASIFSYPVAQDTTMGVWHVTGTVNNYAGMAFGLSCKFDVSAFTGIKFDPAGPYAIYDPHQPAVSDLDL